MDHDFNCFQFIAKLLAIFREQSLTKTKRPKDQLEEYLGGLPDLIAKITPGYPTVEGSVDPIRLQVSRPRPGASGRFVPPSDTTEL